jgi:GNAT superfamily N-acetyltransferase
MMNWYRTAKTLASDFPIKIYDGVLDAHDGQLDCQLVAYPPGLRFDDWPPPDIYGFIQYSIYDNVLQIAMISVPPQYRRMGVATKMMEYLREQHPGTPVDTSFQTKSGELFFANQKDINIPRPEPQPSAPEIPQETDAYTEYGV